MWSPTINSDELYHHGILKMKWGVRNGPPYPLQPGQHSTAEKKAMSKKAKANTDPGKVATKRKFNLSEDQKKTIKKVAVGTAVAAGTVLAIYGGYKVSQLVSYKGLANKKLISAAITRAENEAKSMAKLYGGDDSIYKEKLAKYTKDYVKKAKHDAYGLAIDAVKDRTKYNAEYLKYLKRKTFPDPYDSMFGGPIKPVKPYSLNELEKFSDKATTVTKAANNVTQIPTGASRTVHNVKKTATETAKKVSSGPKLEFGGSSSSSSDLDRLLKASQTLFNNAQEIQNQLKKSTGQRSYTETLLNKNGGKLKNMSMDDLKKLDLY